MIYLFIAYLWAAISVFLISIFMVEELYVAEHGRNFEGSVFKQNGILLAATLIGVFWPMILPVAIGLFFLKD